MRIPTASPLTPHALAVLSMLLAAGCATEEPAPTATPAPPPAAEPTLAISADLFNGSVSFLDLDTLVAPGGTLDAALLEQVDLAPRGQHGPLTIALTADGSRAVVLLSPGVLAFVGGRLGVDTDNLPDTGAGVVVLDIETRQVLAEFPSTDIPIMAAIDEGRNRGLRQLLWRGRRQWRHRRLRPDVTRGSRAGRSVTVHRGVGVE